MKTTYEKKIIFEIVNNSETRITPLNLIKKTVKKTGITPNHVKKLLKELLDEKELAYTCFFGSTYIEPGFSKPVQISEHFVLTPHGINEPDSTDIINIFIAPGISFGSGRHSTTRLALKALDHVAVSGGKSQPGPETDGHKGLDIGTGSGVLAIAACKTCVSKCLALDIDPNSIAEAENNAIINNLETKIRVSDRDAAEITGKFSLILANLRYPTLKKLGEIITNLSEKETVLIMSGIRTHEKESLITLYAENGFKLIFAKDEKNWSCIAMEKHDNPGD